MSQLRERPLTAEAPSGNGYGEMIRVATLEELRGTGVLVVRGADRPIAVFATPEGGVCAVDNRCPHMGFPLHQGTVRDGILICHWHEARFELSSGCTFDLFADDVPAYDVEVRGGEVFVAPLPRQGGDRIERRQRRLEEGLEQNIGLIQAKAILGLLRAGVDYRDVVRQIALFGGRNRDSWSAGMTSLAALANLIPNLSPETTYLALYQGSIRVADDCAGRPPRRAKQPLDTGDVSLSTLKRWLLEWTTVRHRDAAERTILTAIDDEATPQQLGDLLYTAATQRFYADGGHLLDFTNKAAELLDLIGWEYAGDILPLVLGQLASARGGEEQGHWRYPVDLVPPLEQAARDLPDLLRQGEGKTWNDERALIRALLSDDPLANIQALRDALAAGARPEQVSKALACAAALRVARFGTANEFGDWITVLHTFTYCNAIDRAVRRCPTPEVLRGVFHGAASVYFDRFLNVPPASLPGERSTDALDAEPDDPETLLKRLREAFDGQKATQAAARAVARYLKLGHPVAPLFDALTMAGVREDADFHTLQMVEAGIRQYREWEGEPEAEQILVAVARYLAAHSPTPRARLQTARIALRLHRGDSLYEEDGKTAPAESEDGDGGAEGDEMLP
jgi:nitrite reductase/ring-hydroxylating ferredoxin subunit